MYTRPRPVPTQWLIVLLNVYTYMYSCITLGVVHTMNYISGFKIIISKEKTFPIPSIYI